MSEIEADIEFGWWNTLHNIFRRVLKVEWLGDSQEVESAKCGSMRVKSPARPIHPTQDIKNLFNNPSLCSSGILLKCDSLSEFSSYFWQKGEMSLKNQTVVRKHGRNVLNKIDMPSVLRPGFTQNWSKPRRQYSFPALCWIWPCCVVHTVFMMHAGAKISSQRDHS